MNTRIYLWIPARRCAEGLSNAVDVLFEGRLVLQVWPLGGEPPLAARGGLGPRLWILGGESSHWQYETRAILRLSESPPGASANAASIAVMPTVGIATDFTLRIAVDFTLRIVTDRWRQHPTLSYQKHGLLPHW